MEKTMKNSPITRFFLAAALSAVLLGSGCRFNNSPATSTNQADSTGRGERVAGKRGGSLSYRVASPPVTFNYITAGDEPSLFVAFYLMGGRLVEFDHETQRYVPALAEAWNWGGDGRSLEVTLRDGLKFSDGLPLTSDDVSFTLQAIYDKRTASPIFRDAMLIGGREIKATAVDSRRLRLSFPEPVAAPESYLSNLAVMPRRALEADFKKGAFREAYGLNSDPSRIISAGPFFAQSVTPGERVVLKRNPHYWKKGPAGETLPYLDEFVIEAADDMNNALARLRQGSLDIIDRIRAGDYAAIRREAGVVRSIDPGPGLNTDHICFNLNGAAARGKDFNLTKRAWFDDARFRRALSHAIDRETLAKVTLRSLATPLSGFVSPGNRAWVNESLPRLDFDLKRAQALLGEAGFTLRGAADQPELYDSQGARVEFTLLVPVESAPRNEIAAVIQGEWAKLGIKMQIAKLGFAELMRRVTESYDYDAVLLGASVSEPDPSSYVNYLRSSSPSHQWHPRQPKPATEWEARIDELLTAQAIATDPAKRRMIFNEIQAILAEQCPVIPIVVRHSASASNVRIGNHRPSALLPYSLWNAEELFVR